MNEELEQVIANASAKLDDEANSENAAWAAGAAYTAWLVLKDSEMPEVMINALVEQAFELEFWRRDTMR